MIMTQSTVGSELDKQKSQLSNDQSIKRKRGRPRVDSDWKRKPRNLSISDQAFRKEEEIVKQLGISSVSELNERIGLGKLVVTISQSDSELEDAPIYLRLKNLLQLPTASFDSILSFTMRMTRQLETDSNDDFICHVIKQATAIIFYTSYTHPDTYLNNPSALIRWIIYRILRSDRSKTKHDLKDTSRWKLSLNQKNIVLWKAWYTLESLKRASRSLLYGVLKMKTIDGLTLSQIRRVLKIQGQELSEEQVCILIKKGIAGIRELSITPSIKVVESQLVSIPENIIRYSDLANKYPLNELEDRRQIEAILRESVYNSHLDFWLNEIDYHLGKEYFDSPNKYKKYQEQLRKDIDKNIDEYLQLKKLEIDKEIAFCAAIADIRRTLGKQIKDEIGELLPLEIILGEDPDYTY